VSKRYQAGILGVGFNPIQAPDAPTIGAATAGAEQVSIAFTAPADVGGSAISSYRVLANPGGIGATTSSSPATVSGLTSGTTYTFSVAAVNSYGFSPYSGTVSSTPVEPTYIEDVFSTYLYTGNGSTQTITNGINLSGQGGLVWAKSRVAANSHILTDTARGVANTLATNFNGAQNALETNALSSFNSNGFTLNNSIRINASGEANVSWTFRKAPNFFDVVTYTGNGGTQNIAHSLGVTPGMIIVKNTTSDTVWSVWHRSVNGGSAYAVLNLSDAFYTSSTELVWGNNTTYVAPTTTQFTVGQNTRVNQSGNTFVAYLFAHVPGSDGIIQCGSFTTDGSGNATVTLGWEPQWVLVKAVNNTFNWEITDTMRGMSNPGLAPLFPNLSAAESSFPTGTGCVPNATGFTTSSYWGANREFIYMAIRRGPMRTPTLGTSVFSPVAVTPSSGTVSTTNFATDTLLAKFRPGVDTWRMIDKLRGVGALSGPPYDKLLQTDTNSAEMDSTAITYNWWNTGFTWSGSYAGSSMIAYAFRRAPGFFDEVCYTGTGVARTVAHNLGVVPEMMIVKGRSSGNDGNWNVYSQALGNTGVILLNHSFSANDIGTSNIWWNSTSPTATQFTVGTRVDSNGSGYNYVAYLFASAPGVSKVGSYTGNGSSQTINCAFTTGARFVMIKRTDSAGDWYVWDSARGIVAGNDPYLALNTASAEVTSNDSVDTDSTGFIVNQVAASNINVNAATYIFLAIS